MDICDLDDYLCEIFQKEGLENINSNKKQKILENIISKIGEL